MSLTFNPDDLAALDALLDAPAPPVPTPKVEEEVQIGDAIVTLPTLDETLIGISVQAQIDVEEAVANAVVDSVSAPDYVDATLPPDEELVQLPLPGFEDMVNVPGGSVELPLLPPDASLSPSGHETATRLIDALMALRLEIEMLRHSLASLPVVVAEEAEPIVTVDAPGPRRRPRGGKAAV